MQTLGWAALIAATLLTAGCFRMDIHDDEARAPEDFAKVIGDPRFRAGAPMSLLLRKVDDRTVLFFYDEVKLPAGVHTLLVDCQINGTIVSRHPIEMDLYGNTKYRILGDYTPGNRDCTNVRLEVTKW